MSVQPNLYQEDPSPVRNNLRGNPHRPLIKRLESARLPTVYGEFRAYAYEGDDQREHVALCMGSLDDQANPLLVRVHSECLTGDVLGSVRCDCREQLIASLRQISAEGRGILIYLRQEGRGIGLANKIRAYSLQDDGLDTVDANLHLGFPADGRSFAIAAAMLRDLGVARIRLLTNNPQKIADLEAGQIEVVERVTQHITPRPENVRYLQAKVARMGHLFDEVLLGTPIGDDAQNPHPDGNDNL